MSLRWHGEHEQLDARILAAQAHVRHAVTVPEIYTAGTYALEVALRDGHHHLLSIDAEHLQWIEQPPPVERPPWASQIPARLSVEMLDALLGTPAQAAHLLHGLLRDASLETTQIDLDGFVIALMVSTPHHGVSWSQGQRELLAAVAAAMSAQLALVVAVQTGAPAPSRPAIPR